MVCGLLEMLVLRVLVMGYELVSDLVHILWVTQFILGFGASQAKPGSRKCPNGKHNWHSIEEWRENKKKKERST